MLLFGACRTSRPIYRPYGVLQVSTIAKRIRVVSSSSSSSMEKVEFGSGVPAYICGEKNSPGVLMLQEWWGITEEIKDQANFLASNGFRVMIPDLYKGKLGLDAEEAGHLMHNLDWNLAKEEIKDAAKYLRADGSEKIGITGFCMGGALTLIGLQHSDDIACGAPFYGTPSAEICQPEKIAKPVQGHFGELDTLKGFADPEAAKALEGKLQMSDGVFIYEGVGHAFMNSDATEPRLTADKTAKTGFPATKEEVKKLAWERLIAFFKKHLC